MAHVETSRTSCVSPAVETTCATGEAADSCMIHVALDIEAVKVGIWTCPTRSEFMLGSFARWAGLNFWLVLPGAAPPERNRKFRTLNRKVGTLKS